MFSGIVLGLIATVLYNAGFVLEKRALRDLPPLSMRRIGRLVRLLATSRAWLTGFLVMGLGMACQIIVMSLVPLSVAQPIQLAGLALLVVFSAVFLGERTTQREWAGLGVLGLSLLLVCLSMEPTRLGLHAGTGVMLAVIGGTVCLGLAAFVTAARSGARSGRPTGLLYGAASGLLYGAAGLQTKGVSGFLADGEHHFVSRTLTSPYPYLYLALSGAGLLLFQTALQRGRASIVVPVSSVVGSVYTVLAGTAVFGEPLPQDPLRLVLRSAGFGAAILVVAFMPHDEQPEPAVGAPALVADRAL